MIDPKQFHIDIENLVAEKGCGYMDALILYQEKAGIEIETVSSLVKQNPLLKAKVEEEAVELLLVKPSVKRLPF